MGAKGSIAKEAVEKKIQQAFGADFIGVVDRKLYVWANDGGERVQIAIQLTCPKNPVGEVDVSQINYGSSAGLDFESDNFTIAVPGQATEVSEEEKENLAKLLEKFGL